MMDSLEIIAPCDLVKDYELSRSMASFVQSFIIRFCAYIRPRYQVSVYRTIGPLVSLFYSNYSLSETNMVLTEAAVMSSNNLYFRANVRKIMYARVNECGS